MMEAYKNWRSAGADSAKHRAQSLSEKHGLAVSVEACEFVQKSDIVDLHLDLEVPVRVLRYNPAKRHERWWKPRYFMGQTDYPRLRETGFTGLCYDIATNPFRSAAGRLATTIRNVEAAERRLRAHPEEFSVVQSHAEYQQAKDSGRTACWITLQGGNAVDHDPEILRGILKGRIHRITLVHLTTSTLGETSSPLHLGARAQLLAANASAIQVGGAQKPNLSAGGLGFVEICNEQRILVDLAHASKATFWSALDAHAVGLPPVVTHTGVEGVLPHWRNVDDAQIRAIAERGGVVGIIFHSLFLRGTKLGCDRAAILDHLEHLIAVGGEGVAALGTDYDGMIVPPHDLPDVTDLPYLVDDMLRRGWAPERIEGILGKNYLRVVQTMRP